MVASLGIGRRSSPGRRSWRAALVIALALAQAAPAFAAQCCLDHMPGGVSSTTAPAADDNASCHSEEAAESGETSSPAQAASARQGHDACKAAISGCCCTFEQGEPGQHPREALAARTPLIFDSNVLPVPSGVVQMTLPLAPGRDASDHPSVSAPPVPLYLSTATFRI